MRYSAFAVLAAVTLISAPAARAADNEATVSTYHADAARSGHYVVPALTWATAGNMRRDEAFDGRVPGNIYAQPLYWHPAGAARGLVIVATEDNVVAALDAITGTTVWQQWLGPSVAHAALLCGNIDPLGITGTPVIDERSGALYPIAYDGRNLFAATGLTFSREWGGAPAVVRLPPDLKWQSTPENFFAPSDWKHNLTMGGINPLSFDLPGDGSATALLVALAGNTAYLLDRADLGGFDRPLAELKVALSGIIVAPAAYRAGSDMLVVFRAGSPICPGEKPFAAVVALRISRGPPATMRTEWCARLQGQGAPIVTTSDDTADPIVWIVGAEGDEQLHGFRGDNGQELFTGNPLPGLRHFVTILAAAGRLYVAGDGRVFAFGPAH